MSSTVNAAEIDVYTGATLFPWLSELNTTPENHQAWESDQSLTTNQPHVIYPKNKHPNQLIIKSLSATDHALYLDGLTSINFDNKTPEYLGLFCQNLSQTNAKVAMTLTFSDDSTKTLYLHCQKQGEKIFTGIIVNKGISIKKADIRNTGDIVIDDLQWGRFPKHNDKQNTNSLASSIDTKNQDQTNTCQLKAQVMQLQCDDNQWLFDVMVTGKQSESAWWCSNDNDEQCASYGKLVSYGYYSKTSRQEVDLTFTDQKDPSCSTTLHVNLLKNCKDKCSYHEENGIQVETCEERNGNLVTTPLKHKQLSMIFNTN